MTSAFQYIWWLPGGSLRTSVGVPLIPQNGRQLIAYKRGERGGGLFAWWIDDTAAPEVAGRSDYTDIYTSFQSQKS